MTFVRKIVSWKEKPLRWHVLITSDICEEKWPTAGLSLRHPLSPNLDPGCVVSKDVFVFVYLCICICICVFVYLYLCICICVFVFVYLYLCICIYVFVSSFSAVSFTPPCPALKRSRRPALNSDCWLATSACPGWQIGGECRWSDQDVLSRWSWSWSLLCKMVALIFSSGDSLPGGVSIARW